MPHAVGLTYITDLDRYEGKVSEVCARSPFIPVQLSLVHGDGTIVFFKKAMIRNNAGELLHVDYESETGLQLRVINDLR